MTRVTAAVVVVMLSACNSGRPGPAAKLWTTRDFQQKHGVQVNFGGWFPSELLVFEGEAIPFRDTTQASGAGLTLFPAVADGKPAAFVVTEIWQNHAQPWVEPVWSPVSPEGGRPEGVFNVFPVGLDSTFYTPFWKAEVLVTPNLTPETYRDARDVLNAKVERRPGPYLVCPIMPEGVGFADDGNGLRDPMTLQPVTLASGVRDAWVDRVKVSYFDFGPRVRGEGDEVFASDFYVFVQGKGERPLPLAAVLPSNPLQNALVNRVDVPLPSGARAFVPSNRPELRAMLEARGLQVPVVSSTLDRFTPYALRVATNPECFDAPDFPASCDWLDSVARLQRFRSDQLLHQPVQLTLGVTLPPEVTP